MSGYEIHALLCALKNPEVSELRTEVGLREHRLKLLYDLLAETGSSSGETFEEALLPHFLRAMSEFHSAFDRYLSALNTAVADQSRF